MNTKDSRSMIEHAEQALRTRQPNIAQLYMRKALYELGRPKVRTMTISVLPDTSGWRDALA